ncbi:MAG: SIMPL domain-containing protein [Bacteroidetes bacterium]|nr:SIMPL domain-containing protein [Bacteroidota bacterium]
MKNWINAVIFSVAIIGAAIVLAGTWRKTHETKETIKVTGLAEKDFTSDLVIWSGSFSQHSMTVKEAYSRLKLDADNIKRYLVSKGVAEKEITLSSVYTNKDYKYLYDNNGRQTNQIFDGYTLTQSVQIESKEVDKIETVSREVTELLNMGIEFQSQEPRYYYTKLATLKLEMLAAASKDAYNRAEQIAKNAGGGLGGLRNAQMGIFQITGQNSDEEYSYGGTYNTSSKNKKASITAKLEFAID